jgi:hypothetical protein
MEALGTLFAILLMLLTTAAVIALLKAVYYRMAGRTKPLQVAGASVRTGMPTPTLYAHDWMPDDTTREYLTAHPCPLHGKQSIGIALVHVLAPPSAFTMVNPLSTEKVQNIGRTFVEICDACIPEATSLLVSQFVWKRDNRSKHPQWGEHAILPHLVYSNYCRLVSVRKMEPKGDGNMEDVKWVECLIPDDNVFTNDQPLVDIAQSYVKTITGWGMPALLVGHAIQPPSLQKFIQFAENVRHESALLLIDNKYLITDKGAYAMGKAKSKPVSISFEEFRRADIVCNPMFVRYSNACPGGGQWSIRINNIMFAKEVMLKRPHIDMIVHTITAIAERHKQHR